ncbi:glycosyltransferase family 4 protein [Flavobacterium rhizosphaerae]|uniref:Glycosyltransferase family 4 protein n=1 Tax=Flavobacterium rhizosphaerae TaxID=3163298 RepID=A0ABW8YXA2_9FLAO
MKILFLSYNFYPDIGGIEINSEILAGYFNKFGAEIRLITNSQISTNDDKVFPYPIIRKPNNFELVKQHLWADVIFENNPSLNLSWPTIITSKKKVIAIRTWISRMDGSLIFQDKLKLWGLNKADAVIAVSNKVKELTFKNAIVIGNPYRVDLFKNFGVEKNKDFVFLGRLVSDKGADMAINLLRLLIENNKSKNYTLTIIGDGPEKMNLHKIVAKYNLEMYISFTGILKGKSLVEILNQHKYILVPSRWREPFGNVALEGMACGCLPIVSDDGGLIDAIGDAGISFERNNEKSLFEKVKYLLENPDLERFIRKRFNDHLINHHPEVVAKKYYDVILSVYKSDCIDN